MVIGRLLGYCWIGLRKIQCGEHIFNTEVRLIKVKFSQLFLNDSGLQIVCFIIFRVPIVLLTFSLLDKIATVKNSWCRVST